MFCVSRSGEGNGNWLVFLPGKFHGQRSLEGYCHWDCRVVHQWATEQYVDTLKIYSCILNFCMQPLFLVEAMFPYTQDTLSQILTFNLVASLTILAHSRHTINIHWHPLLLGCYTPFYKLYLNVYSWENNRIISLVPFSMEEDSFSFMYIFACLFQNFWLKELILLH